MKKMTPYIILSIIILIFLIIIGFNSCYQVNTNERAVLTRFGKYIKSQEPGLRLKIPFFDKAIKVPVEEQLKEEFGFETKEAGVKSSYIRSDYHLREASMLTADLKIIQIEWIIQYRINDPKAFLFNVRNEYLLKKYVYKINDLYLTKEKEIDTLRTMTIISMSQVAGDYLFDEIITIAKSEITYKVQSLLQTELDKLNMGISIQRVELINVTPPKPVEQAYNEVIQAQQEKVKIINDAKAEYNKIVLPAKGKRDRLIAEAQGYKAKRTEVAKAEVEYFNNLYREYIVAPEVTKKRMYLETMSEILPKLNNIYVVDEKQQNLVPLMQMGLKNFELKGE